MDVVMQMKVLSVARKLLMGQTENVSAVTYTPQKVEFPGITEGVWHFPVSSPEEQGIRSEYLEAFFRELSQSREADPHSVLIVRNGYVIASGDYAPYRSDLWHISHSMCKSVTGLAIGMLISEGLLSLDEKIDDIFPHKGFWLNPSLWHKSITVRHLLTMTSGVAFAEAGVVGEEDYVKAFLESNRMFEPGEKFSYNSMNTLMLSAIIQEKTGQTMMEYLTPRLWEPLGIRNVYWETSHTGITKGGWGLNICIEDMAKLGQLYLNGGIWEGRQIVPKEWLEESSKKQVDSDPAMSPYGYGYQVWQGKLEGSYHFNGMFGQNVFIMPKYQMIVATTAGSAEVFGSGRLTALIYQYFQSGQFHPEEGPLPPNPGAYRSLRMTLAGLTFHEPFAPKKEQAAGGWRQRRNQLAPAGRIKPTVLHDRSPRRERDSMNLRMDGERFLSKQSGRTWKLEKNAAGVLPLFLQVMHNNYTVGIQELHMTFDQDTHRMELELTEGEDFHRIQVQMPGTGDDPLRIARFAESVCSFRGEPYRIGAGGAYVNGEEEGFCVRAEICFLETSSIRSMEICFRGDEIEIRWNEFPELSGMIEGMEPMISGGEGRNTPLKFLGELELTKNTLDRVFMPRVTGRIQPEETEE